MSFFDELNHALDAFHLLKHPFYRAWTEGKLTLSDLQTYACQYYPQVLAFPRYVSATHSNCPSLAERQDLLRNLLEEELGPNNHIQLWLNFAAGLGVDETTVKQSAVLPEAEALIDHFLTTCRSSYAEGLGALYAYERQIPDVSASKIDGLCTHYGISDPKTTQFFHVHQSVDVEHTEDAKQLIDRLPPAEKNNVRAAALSTAEKVWDLLTGIYHQTIGLREPAMVCG